MSEYVTRTIKIELLRDPTGRPACAIRGKACAMLTSELGGFVLSCHEIGKEPQRDMIDGLPIGYLRPLPDCKIWAEYATQKATND